MKQALENNGCGGYAVTIGTFDGLHRGHKAVIDTLSCHAALRGLNPMVMTFDRHPLEVVAPERAPQLIISNEKKSEMLRMEGVREICLPFSKETAAISAAQWLRMLHDEYGVSLLVLGYDNTFGCDGRSLSMDDYRRLGEEAGVQVVVAPVLEGVSSSAIRRALNTGDVQHATSMLGRPFELSGVVVKGEQLGRKIGFPTANISVDSRSIIPGNGVYHAETIMNNGRAYPVVVNIGVRPSVNKSALQCIPTIEVHIPGFSGDLYGQRLTVRFLRFLRPEKHFPSLTALSDAIAADVEKIINYDVNEK